MGPSVLYGYENFSARGHAGGTAPPSVYLMPSYLGNYWS